ncbi:MAG: hypothetical protein WBY53_03280 [Acidobacteriaceae bacterium]
MNNYNATALHEARQTVSRFEATYNLISAEMLKCAECDPRIAGIDPFEMIDWHYALEIVQTLENNSGIVDSIQSMDEDAKPKRAFLYHCRQKQDLVNSVESELELVA